MAPIELNCAILGAGPGLVLLHPVGLDHDFWGPLPDLSARSHRVLRVDLRGHGLSPTAQVGLRLSDYVGDVLRAMATHEIGPAAVLGLSFGGMIAQELALQAPDAVSSLILCGCPGTFGPDARPTVRERGLAAERGGMSAVLDATINRWFTPSFRADPVVGQVRERLQHNNVAGWSAAWHAIAEFDALPRLGQVRSPTLVVSGENDVATPVSASTALAAAIPNAQLTVLPRAPHMMQLECSTAFGSAVMNFLHRS